MTYAVETGTLDRDRVLAERGRVRVGFAICDPGLSFGAIVGLGAKERAAELDVNISIVSVFTPRQQATVIERFIAEAVDVLIVEAVESQIVVPAIQEAGAAGIPVIVADMRIHGAEAACTVRSDNVTGGELAAGYLVDRLQGQGLVAHLQGLLTSDNGLDRSRGFHNVVDRHPGIRIVEASSEWTSEGGATAMRDVLARRPSVQAVFANNDPLALGALAAIDEAGRTGEIVVAGFDALPNALLAIEEGTLAATVRQMPRSMGRLALELALRVYSGECVPPVVETDVALVTAENVAEASLATLPLFPRVLLDLIESGAALAEERTLLRTLIDNLPDLTYVKDTAGRFVLVNTAALRYFGATSHEDVVGRTDFDFFPAELASQYHADEQTVIESGQPLINHEERSTDSAGNAHWLSTTKVPARDSSGSIVGLVGMNRDITERKQAEAEQARLVEEQAALRRVATLVAQAAPPDHVFAAVADEVGHLLGLPRIEMVRFEADGTGTVIGASGDHPFPAGSRWALDGPSIMESVLRTGSPVRIDDYTELPGTIAEVARNAGFRSAIGAPIIVDGATWGVVIAISTMPEPIPEGSEIRLSQFTELVATAISNLQARNDLRDLADEQAALHRVATLVAEGTDSPTLFDAVCAEAGQLVGASTVNLSHYTPDGFNVTMAGWSLRDTHVPTGTRFPLTPDTVGGAIVRTHAPARVDSWEGASSELAKLIRERGIRSSVGAPVVVEGQLWGALIAATDREEPLPPGTELRLARFTELVATAISNLQARDELHGLVDEQAALRSVATLVAEGATPEEVFSAVAREAAQVLHVSAATLERYEPDGTAVTLALSRDPDWEIADSIAYTGRHWPNEPGGLIALVWETGKAARVDDYSEVGGSAGEAARAAGLSSACAAPIMVDGKLWGLIRVYSRQGTLLPDDTEGRLYGFAELAATALSNAAARAELIASRVRIVAAGDEARRRIERNLHDGTQQRLIALGLDLQRIRATLSEDQQDALSGLDRLAEDLESVLADVRELSRGLHPPLLSRGGLRPSLRALARRSPMPVDIDIELHERPPPAIETAVYYVVAEALTNAIRHAEASTLSVTIATDHAGGPFGVGLDGSGRSVNLHATIADDGVGGAEASTGSGLVGVRDRVDALGGRFALDSPPGRGTRISIELPLGAPTRP